MRIRIATQVAQTPEKVWQGFNRSLFLALAPPFPPFRLLRFDGCEAGQEVHIEINMLLMRQLWVSHITDHYKRSDEWGFVDEGARLPFFLRTWRHRHRLVASKDGTLIIDDITFSSPLPWLDWALYPALWLQFAYRKPIYRKIFGIP